MLDGPVSSQLMMCIGVNWTSFAKTRISGRSIFSFLVLARLAWPTLASPSAASAVYKGRLA